LLEGSGLLEVSGFNWRHGLKVPVRIRQELLEGLQDLQA
jgi:hypothetical protein